MSTGPTTQAAFIPEQQRASEHDASRSALFYLLQEVSRLASPVHTNSPKTRLNETCRPEGFITEMQEEDGRLFKDASPVGQVNKMEEKSPRREMETVAERRCGSMSPWNVLSLINLHCERLLEESHPKSAPSNVTKVPVADDKVGGDTLSPSHIKRRGIPASVSLVSASSQPQPGDKREAVFHVNGQSEESQGCEMECLNEPRALTGLSPSKPTLTLDCNANIVSTPCDSQLSPPSTSLPPPLSAPLSSSTTERGHSLPEADEQTAGSRSDRSHDSLDEESLQSELGPVPGDDITPAASGQWRTKTPRKQPHPSRSVDTKDPDIQGVRFRMGSELDDSREQCRLLITSKYSRELFKSLRKPRPRTRTSHKSLKTSSSDEECDQMFSKDKVCASCRTRKTPMWRDAEDGTPLCNACGIRFKKYRVRCVNCWHIPRKEGNSSSCCLRCGNSLRLTSAQQKHSS